MILSGLQLHTYVRRGKKGYWDTSMRRRGATGIVETVWQELVILGEGNSSRHYMIRLCVLSPRMRVQLSRIAGNSSINFYIFVWMFFFSFMLVILLKSKVKYHSYCHIEDLSWRLLGISACLSVYKWWSRWDAYRFTH